MLFILILLLQLCSCLAANQQSSDDSLSSVDFNNDRRLLFDTDGNQIDAYGSKVNLFNGTYYLYGNSFSATGVALGIKVYSSNDLNSWTHHGYLYDPSSPSPCDGIGGCGRPHIVYNRASNLYVLWANAGSSGYVVATASSPVGPYAFIGRSTLDPQFAGLQPADFAVESFGDQAYLVFSVLNFRYPAAGSLWPPIQQTLHVSELTSDFLNVSTTSYNVSSADFDLIDQEAESPDLFMRDGIFYVVASNTCGYCNGSIALVYRASSIHGPWTRQIIAGDGCNSQVEGVLPLQLSNGSTNYVWHGTSVPGGPRTGFGGHIFQPLDFNSDGSVQPLNCANHETFSVEFQPGNGSTSTGNATASTDSSPLDAVYTPVCDSDTFSLVQTWTASKSGTLTQIAVNIAASVQTTPLVLKAIAFSNISALSAPNYRWTDLGNATFSNATALTYVFNTASIYLNATVQKGDHLGVQISGADFAPYCHLEYDLATSSTQVLLQQGLGQNSWRGLNGMTSVVYPRTGKGLKFFAVIE